MFTKILELLGLGGGASVVSKALGTINLVTITPLAIWAWTHRDEQVTFTMSLGVLAALAVLVYVLLELNRRAVYRNGGPMDRQL